LQWKEKKKEDREFLWATARSILKAGKHSMYQCCLNYLQSLIIFKIINFDSSEHPSNKGRTHEAARDTMLVIQEAGLAADSPSGADSHYHYDDAGLEGLDDMQSIGGDVWLCM
jgi:hypothetical protein